MTREPSVLQTAVKEVVSALLSGDWVRFSKGEDGPFYYVIRETDRQLLDSRGDEWDEVGFPAARVESDFEDWYVRTVLAEATRDHFERLRKQMQQAGFSSEVVDEFIQAARSASSDDGLREIARDWVPRLFGRSGIGDDPEALALLLALVDAIRIQGTKFGHFLVSDADRQALRRAFELRLLKELGERFGKAVDRATTFDDWLLFYSPHLREAVRCYLYGFFSAAVLSAVAALDARMRTIAKVASSDNDAIPYKQLVARVFGIAGVLGADAVIADALNALFEHRNKIAHEGAEATSEMALHAITVARGALDRMPIVNPQDSL